MRVVFDDIFLVNGKSGIARYWRSVFKELAESDLLASLDLELIILNRSGALEEVGLEVVDFPRVGIDNPYVAEDRRLLTRICQSLRADVFLSSYYTFPLDTPTIGFIYDLIPERRGFQYDHWTWIERKLATYASRSFIAISRSTLNDLIELYPWIEASNCVIAKPGLDMKVFTRATDERITDFKERNQLHQYLVYAGVRGTGPDYKNFKLVLDSIDEGYLSDFDLVLTGGEPISSEEMKVFNRHGIRAVRLQVDDDELAVCLSGAVCLLYPSLYEGFGLPPLESLAVGTPVITTYQSSLPESVGELSLCLSGFDTFELATQVKRSTDPEWRRKIREDGPKWAENFSWRDTATTIIQHIADSHQRGQLAISREVTRDLVEYNQAVRMLQC